MVGTSSIHKTTLPLAEEDTVFFKENGYIYIRDFYPSGLFSKIKTEIGKFSDLFAEYHKLVPTETDRLREFDWVLPELLKKDRRLAGAYYEGIKKLPSIIQAVSHRNHSVVCSHLAGMQFPGFASRGWGVRLDHPGENVYLTQLHQDFVSQLCSEKGLVFWTPFRNVDRNLGPLRILPKSHLQGVFPIRMIDNGSRGLRLLNEEKLRESFEEIAPEVQENDCVVLDILTLHESSINISNQTRWSLISRYFDFSDPSGARMNWVGGLQEGNSFADYYPELVVFK